MYDPRFAILLSLILCSLHSLCPPTTTLRFGICFGSQDSLSEASPTSQHKTSVQAPHDGPAKSKFVLILSVSDKTHYRARVPQDSPNRFRQISLV
jgi:hypothetical protein